MSQITEFVTLPTSLRSVESMQELLKVLCDAEGLLRGFYGPQLEDGNVGFIILEWENIDQQKKFLADEALQPFLEDLKKYAGESTVLNVKFGEAHSTQAFTAPVTEISTATLKAGADRAVWETLLRALHDGAGATPGTVTSAWGQSVENADQYVSVIGWESIEAHKTASAPEQAADMLKKIHEFADFEVKHAELSLYEKA